MIKISEWNPEQRVQFWRHLGHWHLLPSIVFCPRQVVRDIKLRRAITLHWLAWSLHVRLQKYEKPESKGITGENDGSV